MALSSRVRPGLLLALAIVGAGCGGGGRPGPGDGSSGGRIVGRVLSAPSCPMQRTASPCPPRPVVGGQVEAFRGATSAAHARTGPAGGFTLRLRPGAYRVVAHSTGGYGSTATTTVQVAPAQATEVTLTVDSGIR